TEPSRLRSSSSFRRAGGDSFRRLITGCSVDARFTAFFRCVNSAGTIWSAATCDTAGELGWSSSTNGRRAGGAEDISRVRQRPVAVEIEDRAPAGALDPSVNPASFQDALLGRGGSGGWRRPANILRASGASTISAGGPPQFASSIETPAVPAANNSFASCCCRHHDQGLVGSFNLSFSA